MSWLISLIWSVVPHSWGDLVSLISPLWPVAAAGSLGLWVWSLIVARQPGGTIAAEIIRLGTIGCACSAAALAVWAAADGACEARVAAATAAETERQRVIVGDALTEARAAATTADAAREAAERRLADALAALPPDNPPPPTGYGGGLSPSSVRALRAGRSGR
jgi:hypothetical protein